MERFIEPRWQHQQGNPRGSETSSRSRRLVSRQQSSGTTSFPSRSSGWSSRMQHARGRGSTTGRSRSGQGYRIDVQHSRLAETWSSYNVQSSEPAKCSCSTCAVGRHHRGIRSTAQSYTITSFELGCQRLVGSAAHRRIQHALQTTATATVEPRLPHSDDIPGARLYQILLLLAYDPSDGSVQVCR